MHRQYTSEVLRILRCPDCHEPVDLLEQGAACSHCQTTYPYAESGSLDMRLRHEKQIQLAFQLGTAPVRSDGVNFDRLTKNLHPSVDFSGIQRPHNISEAFLSYFPKAPAPGSIMLDLGCGDALLQDVARCAGFEYVPMDLVSPQALLLGDAQALPFADDSFDLVWTNAVVQYLPFSFVTIREIGRVLKPGGKLMGTVGFLEAFDGDSFYMFTRLGVLNWLQYDNFQVEMIAPDEWWTGLVAISRMGLFPRMPTNLSRALVLPMEALSKFWWRLAALRNASATPSQRLARVTGGFQFLAVKTESTSTE